MDINGFIEESCIQKLLNEILEAPTDQYKCCQLRAIDEKLSQFVLTLDSFVSVDKIERKRVIETIQHIQALIDSTLKSNALINGLINKMARMESEYTKNMNMFSESFNDLSNEWNKLAISDAEKVIAQEGILKMPLDMQEKLEIQSCVIENLKSENEKMKDNIEHFQRELKKNAEKNDFLSSRLKNSVNENIQLNSRLKEKNIEFDNLKNNNIMGSTNINNQYDTFMKSCDWGRAWGDK